MSASFDLSSYEDVRANAEGIYEQLAAGSMPCDGPWPAGDVERFRAWIEAGAQP
jgi:hypothetical protein